MVDAGVGGRCKPSSIASRIASARTSQAPRPVSAGGAVEICRIGAALAHLEAVLPVERRKQKKEHRAQCLMFQGICAYSFRPCSLIFLTSSPIFATVMQTARFSFSSSRKCYKSVSPIISNAILISESTFFMITLSLCDI